MTTINRRAALAALPLGTVGLIAVAKGGPTTNPGILPQPMVDRLKAGADVELETERFIQQVNSEIQSIVPNESFPDANTVSRSEGVLEGILDERGLNYAIERLTEASTSDVSSCVFVAFAHHVSTLAIAGDYKSIQATVERLLDSLHNEHGAFYGETRETWLTEKIDSFAEHTDMDDDSLSDADIERACNLADARDKRRAAR